MIDPSSEIYFRSQSLAVKTGTVLSLVTPNGAAATAGLNYSESYIHDPNQLCPKARTDIPNSVKVVAQLESVRFHTRSPHVSTHRNLHEATLI